MVGMAGNEQDNDLLADLDVFLAEHEAELIEFRRDLHAHPELAFNEHRTTRRVALRLAAAGLRPGILPQEIGRAAWRGKGEISVGGGLLKKKKRRAGGRRGGQREEFEVRGRGGGGWVSGLPRERSRVRGRSMAVPARVGCAREERSGAAQVV